MTGNKGGCCSVDFDLSEDQEMLKAVAERFVSDRYDPDRRRQYLGGPDGFDPANWTCLGELGVVGAAFSEESGGLGANHVALAILFEALGRGVVVEPLAESAVLAGGMFERAAPPILRSTWLDALVTGKRRLAVAYRDAGARRAEGGVTAAAEAGGSAWRLTGGIAFVPAGAGADGYLVGAATNAADPEFFFVPADAPGLTAAPFRLIDGSVGVVLTLRDVAVPEEHRLPSGAEALAEAADRAAVARTAEALGIMEMMFAATLDYLRTRQQFGAPLGSFQALQHRMVAQYAALEKARALLDLAVMCDPADLAASRRAIAGMRAFIADASVTFGHEMIQFHGAMGVTDELIIGQAHRRLMLLSRYPEGATEALDRYAA